MVHRLSLRATGTPASGPGSRPAATAASTRSAAARARSAITRLKAWTSGLGGGDAGQVLLEHRSGPEPAGPDAAAISHGARPADRRRRAASPGAHGASPRIRGTRKRSLLDSRAPGARTSSRSRPGDDHVLAQHVGERQGVGGRRHARGVEGLDVPGVVEDRAQLLGEALQLVRRSAPAGPGGPRAPLRRSRSGSPWATMLGGTLRPELGRLRRTAALRSRRMATSAARAPTVRQGVSR